MNFKFPVAADVSRLTLLTAVAILAANLPHARAVEVNPPPGFTALFNGKDLTGWYGLNADPRKIFKMTDEERAKFRQESKEDVRKHWTAQNGELVNDGYGAYLTT